MRARNPNIDRAGAVVTGHIGRLRSGSAGVDLTDGVTQASEINSIEIVGGSIYDLGDGVVQIVLSGGTFGGTFGGANGLSTDGMVPYSIPVDEEFVVPLYKQGLFAMTIDVVGTLTVDGYLIEVA